MLSVDVGTTESTTRILGIDFFHGSAEEAVDRMKAGGLLVVPAAPALRSLEDDAGYRESLLKADLAITDSAYMVLIWNQISGQHIHRLSGLEYLRELLKQPGARKPGKTVWIMANPRSAQRNLDWLAKEGIELGPDCVYGAVLRATRRRPALVAAIGARTAGTHHHYDRRRKSRAVGPVSEGTPELSACHPLHWRGNRVSER